MVKNIKKSIKYFIIVAAIIIMLPTTIYVVLQIPLVQTLIVKRITKHFSEEIKSTLSVGSIEFRFFNKLSLNDVLIKDQTNDTLIYSRKVTVGLKRIDFKRKIIRLGKVNLINPVVALITDSTGLMNLNWYLNLLKNSGDTASKANIRLTIEQIDINEARFAYIKRIRPESKSKTDFNNLNLSGINGIIEDLKIENDTSSFKIYNLAFKESGGFSVNRFTSSAILTKQNFLLSSTSLNCDSSVINITSLALIADSASSFKNFGEEVKLDVILEKSLISTSDLYYFIPALNKLYESIWISGRIMGTISELRGRDIKLTYRDYTNLDCDFDLSGLPKIENMYMYIGINSLNTNVMDIEKIKIPGKGNIILPEVLYKLGSISFDGSFTGFTSDFVTYGKFRTDIGNIRTDISLRPEKSDKYRIKGLLTGSDIDLGELTGKSDLFGKLSMVTNIDGYASSLKKFAADLTGKIDSVEINKYKYRNIAINGLFTEKTWDGSVKIVDKNIKLDLLGLLNFNNKLPEFNFTLNIADANLYKLNLDKVDTSASVTLLLTADFKGSNIDNLDGEIKLLNSNFRKYNNNLELYDFSIRTYKENNRPVLSLRTDFADADIKGYYNFATIGELVKSTLATLMPSQFQAKVTKKVLLKNNFTFEVNFKNTDKINSFLRTGVSLADKSFLTGSVFSDSIISVTGKAKSLNMKNNSISDLSINGSVTGNKLSVGITSSSLKLLGQTELKGFSIDFNTLPDSFVFTADWDNNDININRGSFTARGLITKGNAGNRNSILKVVIDSTEIYSANNRWKISPSTILVDSSSIKINKLFISNNERYYLVDGSVSKDPADTLHLEFKGIDIAPLNYIESGKNSDDPNKIPLNIKGFLNGKILLTKVYSDLLLESNIVVNNFSILDSEYGNVSVLSTWDKDKKVVQINASNNLNGVTMFDAAGFFDPATRKIDLHANATKLPITFLNPLLKVFASDISGLASGKVNLSGEAGNLVLKGAVMAENASMKINYLQTTYRLNDTIRFDRYGIKFDNIKITDKDGNIATIYGSVNHKNFKEYAADLTININSTDFLVLNTQLKDNELFYGTAYASGVTTIKSGPNSLSFDISAKTGKNTKISIPINSGLSVSEYSFISFIDSTSRKAGEPGIIKNIPVPVSDQVVLDLNIDLEVTPEAEVQIIFDSKVGDKMTGHGSGFLNITLNKKGEFKISGDYTIEDGEYLFTLGNILNKRFEVENGGKIMFNGKIDDAEIELKATYKNLKTSLFPILQDERFNERISVEPQLNLSGKLFNPVVGFDIYLPNADEETRAYLNNAIGTEEELSRQFLYLLVMNSFYPDPAFGSSATSTTTTSTSAMAVTTTEMLSNQLSNWLSQISNDFDVGFVYRPGTKDLNSQEVQVALQTQLLNDKVLINGNFDVRGAGNTLNNTDQITGDFDAEIKLTEKIRFKVFNRFNDTYSGKGPYTQGIGIFFKQDFNKFSDLFRKRVKPDMKKEDETTLKTKK